MPLDDVPTGDEKNDGVPQALKRQHCSSGNMVFVRRLPVYPTMDAVQATGNPSYQNAQRKQKACTEICSLDGIRDDKSFRGCNGR